MAKPNQADQTVDVVERRPILVIASGRGKTGKSAILSYIATTRRRTRPLRIIDADPKNASLSARLPEADTPPAIGEDRRIWIEQQFDKLVADAGTEHEHDMLLDLGGGDLLLKQWGHQIDLSSALIEEGVEPVLIHMLGPDDADLSHLADVETGRVFAPPRTIVVMNAGLVPPTQSAREAFKRIAGSALVQSVQNRGGRVVVMPSLDCMRELEQAGLSFADVLAEGSDASRKLGFANMRRVRRWLREDMPAMHAKIADWLPE
jgi:hypothetical protein